MTSCKFINAQAGIITSTSAWLAVIVRCIPISDRLKCWGRGVEKYIIKLGKYSFFKAVMFNRFTQVQGNRPKSQGYVYK